jgi:hypothetical protein
MIPSLATYDFLSILTPILLAFAALGAMVLDAMGSVAVMLLDASVLKYRAKVVLAGLVRALIGCLFQPGFA